MKAKKSLGQNFLMHARDAERIADASGVGKDDLVLEIGPGTGMLTKALLKRARKVVAVEADNELAPALAKTFENEIASGKLEIVHADIREFPVESLGKEPYHIVANIPYYITGEIIRSFLSASKKPSSMTLLVQKEVAVRIAREKKGSLLSLSVKAYGSPKYCFTVPRGSFVPKPNVDSAVLHIADIRSPFSSSTSEKRFFDILRAGFAHKRKFLAKNLEAVAASDTIRDAFVTSKVNEKARAEDLSLSSWQELASLL